MTPQSAKAKGRKLQQLIRDEILTTFPELSKDDVESTSMGVAGKDIKLSSAAKKRFPYSVEAKFRASISIYEYWEQAVKNTDKGTTPLLVIKANYKDPLAVIPLSHLMEIIKNASTQSS